MKEIIVFQASDGTIFTDKDECKNYQNLIEFDHWYNKDKLTAGDGIYVIDNCDVRDWLIRNRENVLGFLADKGTTTEEAKPKKRRGRRTKAEIEAARLAELVPKITFEKVEDKENTFVFSVTQEEDSLKEIEDNAGEISLDDILLEE